MSVGHRQPAAPTDTVPARRPFGDEGTVLLTRDTEGVVRRASRWLGTPYSWGGGTPYGPSAGFCDGTNGYGPSGECAASVTPGFDCSSLMRYAYWPFIRLPRVSASQYAVTSEYTVGRAALREGDLVFWHNGTRIYHVGLYCGDDEVIHAPRTGKPIARVPLDEAMPRKDYYGATRLLNLSAR
ncbi:C40 family peptidase [Streptomyces sp. NPDC058330]|uniref:C40 family peptidase n=1 Tax=Streptomyces sp. NPDC058330 TaxID=3346449 RepID=UPI0036EC8DB1